MPVAPLVLQNKHIEVFKESCAKAENDETNKIRETVIEYIINRKIPEDWYESSLEWRELKDQLDLFLEALANHRPYRNITCIPRGGRKYKYDFEFIIDFGEKTEKDKHIVKIEKIEFKYGCESITDYPQFIQLPSKSITYCSIDTEPNTDTTPIPTQKSNTSVTYAEHFYNHYMSRMNELYQCPISISKEDYLKYIHQSSEKKHPWFQFIKSREAEHKEEKKKLVDESIHEYIDLFQCNPRVGEEEDPEKEDVRLSKSDTTWIIQTIQPLFESQKNKKYMCYKNNRFYYDSILDEELTITYLYDKIKNKEGKYHTIVFNTRLPTTKIHMLLRWKNRAGILYPAWQIKIVRSIVHSLLHVLPK